ncbi:GPW/gp25 family protein [Paraburkholderia phymatum]|uniref:GPW/gp25 family protein n=1 Tax=Paraburkholderia phymatum TaxID=148447 RepID=A0ACC6U8Q1_9BURK
MNTVPTLPIAAPYGIDGRGRTMEAQRGRHLRDLIEAVLFTAPGERVMRPTFGSGVLGLVFDPNGPGLAAMTQVLVAGALQTWLGDLIEIGGVEVESDDATLTIKVSYLDRQSGDTATVLFGRSV